MHPTLNIAVKAARRAATVINRASTQLDLLTVQSKSPNDFVTEVDQAAEHGLADRNRYRTPGMNCAVAAAHARRRLECDRTHDMVVNMGLDLCRDAPAVARFDPDRVEQRRQRARCKRAVERRAAHGDHLSLDLRIGNHGCSAPGR